MNMGMALSEYADKMERMDRRATEGGSMAEEKDPTEVAVEEADERDPDNLATPTEKQQGAGGPGQGLHSGGSVDS